MTVTQKDIETIGHVRRKSNRYEVHCAACGKGVATQEGPKDRAGALAALRERGWTDKPDKLWRCPDHTPTA